MSLMPGLIEGNQTGLSSGAWSAYYRQINTCHNSLSIIFLTKGLRSKLLIFYISRKSGINLRINYLLLLGACAVVNAYGILIYHIGVYLVACMEVVKHVLDTYLKYVIALAVLRLSRKLLGIAAGIPDNKLDGINVTSLVVDNRCKLKRIIKQSDLALIKCYALRAALLLIAVGYSLNSRCRNGITHNKLAGIICKLSVLILIDAELDLYNLVISETVCAQHSDKVPAHA